MPGSSAGTSRSRWLHGHGRHALRLLCILAPALSLPGRALAGDPFDHATDGCRASIDSTAAPATLALGEPVNVQTRVRFDCPDRQRPYHLVLVIDASAVAKGASGDWAPAALAALVERMSLAANTRARVGVVTFDNDARTACVPTNRTDIVARCIERLAASDQAPNGNGGLTAGLAAGIRALVLARSLAPPRQTDDPVREELLVLAAPGAAADPGAASCAGAVSAADAARRKGIGVGAVCLSGGCQDTCLPHIASETQLYRHDAWETAADRQVARVWSTQTRVRKVSLRDLIAREVIVDPTSPDPDGAVYDPDERSLRWDIDLAGRDAAWFAHVVRPTAAGLVPVRISGQLIFEDTQGGGEILRLPVPYILAVDGRPARVFAPFAVRMPGRNPQTFSPPARDGVAP